MIVMKQVVRALESEEMAGLYQAASKPGYSTEHDSEFGGGRFGGGGSDYDTQQYNADMSRARKLAFNSKTFGSDVSSEYGANPATSSEYDRSKEMASDYSSGEALIEPREQVPTSVRSGSKNKPTIPTGRSRMTAGYSGGPPQRAAPQRTGYQWQRQNDSTVSTSSDRSGSIKSDILNMPPPLPPSATYDEDYAPIDFNSSSVGNSRQYEDQIKDGR